MQPAVIVGRSSPGPARDIWAAPPPAGTSLFGAKSADSPARAAASAPRGTTWDENERPTCVADVALRRTGAEAGNRVDPGGRIGPAVTADRLRRAAGARIPSFSEPKTAHKVPGTEAPGRPRGVPALLQ
jgi:hypothetical protein